MNSRVAGPFFALVCASAGLFSTQTAFAISFGPDTKPKVKTPTSRTAKGGPYALVEVNPADLIHQRGRLQSEYLVVDGFAFGFATEYQRQTLSKWRHSTAAAGVTATQYIQSQSLKGLFVKGEANLFGSQFQVTDKLSPQHSIYGLGFGLDAGYRVSLSQRVTCGAAYGVRRQVPDFFNPQGTPVSNLYSSYANLWDFRVQLSLGVAL